MGVWVEILCGVLLLYLTQNYPLGHRSVKLLVLVFFHLRRLRQLRGVVTDEIVKQLVTSLVLTGLGYCNSVLYELPAFTLVPLQRVQNVAARLVFRLDHQAHTSSLRYRVFTGCLWRHELSLRSKP